MSNRINASTTTRGTCPVCGCRVRVNLPRADEDARRCGRHLLYIGDESKVCTGTRMICKEDGGTA